MQSTITIMMHSSILALAGGVLHLLKTT